MHPFDLDPSVTPEEVEAAQADPTQPFPADAEQDDADDEVLARALVAPVIATPNQALATAKHYTDASVFVGGVGWCLRTVRGYFNVAALWPDANDAQAHSAPFHKVTDPLKLPRGSVGYCRNATHGHVWLNLGGGLCRTTDFHRPGMVDIARVDKVVAWASGTDLGWGEVLNGVDVWPNPKKPKPKTPPKSWTWERRVQFLRNEAVRQQRDGHGPRAQQLRDWADKIAARHR